MTIWVEFLWYEFYAYFYLLRYSYLVEVSKIGEISHKIVWGIKSSFLLAFTNGSRCLRTLLAAATAAKSLQSCLTLCDPIDGSPPGSPIPGILQARILEWVAISFSNAWKWKVKEKSLRPVHLFATPWTAAYQAPRPMGFSRQEYWSGVPLPSPNLLEESGNTFPFWEEQQAKRKLFLSSFSFESCSIRMWCLELRPRKQWNQE